MGTPPPPLMWKSSSNSSPLVSRAVFMKTARVPATGLSIVSPALAMMLLPFPRTDIMPPELAGCMPRNPYSPECVEGEFLELLRLTRFRGSSEVRKLCVVYVVVDVPELLAHVPPEISHAFTACLVVVEHLRYERAVHLLNGLIYV